MEGPELVKAVSKLHPEASIEEVLEKVRRITLERIFFEIREAQFDTPIHIVEELCDRSLTLEDTVTILEWMADFQPEIGDDIRRLTESRSIETVYKFCQTELSSNLVQPTCCWRRPCTKSKGKRGRQPS